MALTADWLNSKHPNNYLFKGSKPRGGHTVLSSSRLGKKVEISQTLYISPLRIIPYHSISPFRSLNVPNVHKLFVTTWKQVKYQVGNDISHEAANKRRLWLPFSPGIVLDTDYMMN